jgi:hypothetical protein
MSIVIETKPTASFVTSVAKIVGNASAKKQNKLEVSNCKQILVSIVQNKSLWGKHQLSESIRPYVVDMLQKLKSQLLDNPDTAKYFTMITMDEMGNLLNDVIQSNATFIAERMVPSLARILPGAVKTAKAGILLYSKKICLEETQKLYANLNTKM